MNSLITEPGRRAHDELDAFLDECIDAFNIEATDFDDGRPFAGTISGEAGNIVAAINGHTWGGCCHVMHLWVHEAVRRRGFGSRLLRAAEEEAMRRGCMQMLLLTHSFQAPGFHERLGYVRVATIPNYPQGHAQHAYVKLLADGARAGAR